MTVILVIHILVSVVLVGVVLMQRSEGGALGVGGGGGGAGGGGLMSGRGAAGALVRTTIIFGAIFFITSLTLTTISSRNTDGMTDIERQLQEESGGDPLDVVNDPSAPLLDEGDPAETESDVSAQPAEPEGEIAPPATGTETTDPLAADVAPQSEDSEEAVDEPQQ